MIRLVTYNRAELSELIDSSGFAELPFLPISYHRAISHVNNPRADAEDVMLILAYDENKPVGYLGVLPDWIYDMNGLRSKCGWLSCMWIDPECRGKGISKKLVAQALASWQRKILVTEFTLAAKGLYDKTGAFKDLQIKEGIRLYIRSDLAKLLPPKGQNFARLKPIWQATDAVLNLLLDFRFSLYRRKLHPNWEYVQNVDEEVQNYIKIKQGNQIFRRQQTELNWILQYPWILSREEDEMSRKYYFSSVAKIFEFIPLKIRDQEGKLLGFLLFARRDYSMKIPFCYFEEKYLQDVIDCIIWHTIHWKIKTFTVFHSSLVRYFSQHRAPALFSKPLQRHYIISKTFESFSTEDDYDILDGDADCVFT